MTKFYTLPKTIKHVKNILFAFYVTDLYHICAKKQIMRSFVQMKKKYDLVVAQTASEENSNQR